MKPEEVLAEKSHWTKDYRLVDLRQRRPGCQHVRDGQWCGRPIVAVWVVHTREGRPIQMGFCQRHDALMEDRQRKERDEKPD